jgi:hypothetical protein
LITSPTTHCRIISLKKIKIGNWFLFLIKKFFVDVDGPFLGFQNGGNSPHTKI